MLSIDTSILLKQLFDKKKKIIIKIIDRRIPKDIDFKNFFFLLFNGNLIK